MKLRGKIIVAMALVGLVVVAASLTASGIFRYGEILAEFQTFVRSVAGTTAISISADDLNQIQSNDDSGTAAFRRVRAILKASQEINGLRPAEIYILRSTTDGRFEMEFVAMLQDDTFIGDRYTIPEANRQTLRDSVRLRKSSASRPYSDENGRWISGFAPIFDAGGEPVALLVADAEISDFLDRLRGDLIFSGAAGLLALALAMVPGILLANRITGGIQRLSAGMQRFHDGQTDVTVDVRTGDEIEALGSAFNDMIISLGEKLALLPYVSRFTAEAVRRSQTDPSWLTGSEQDVTVLFADLRGFTRFSETREADTLVRELNQLLSVQADVVVSAGGDVDKFIGDAIMAVFLSAEHAPAHVMQCATRLIVRVNEATDRFGWDLGLGVGIHRGRAIVGSIGSETRRDFTAIGHTVNLASRLCDHASPWQILVSADFYDLLSEAERMRFSPTEPISFKNIDRAVVTYACNNSPESRST